MTNTNMSWLVQERVHEIDTFRRPTFCHHYLMLSMTDLCSAVENRKFIRQKYNFNMSLMLTGPSTKKLSHG